MNLFDQELLREYVREEAAARLLASEFERFGMPPGPPGPPFFMTPTEPAPWVDRDMKKAPESAFPLPLGAESRPPGRLP